MRREEGFRQQRMPANAAYVRRMFVGLVLLSLLTACSGPQGIPEQVRTVQSQVVPAFIQSLPEEGADYTRDQLVATLGEPVEVQEREHMHIVRYYGLDVGIRAPRGVVYIAFTDARYTAPGEIRVGHPENQIVRLLGAPARRQQARLEYDMVGAQQLIILLEHDIASRVEWWLDPGNEEQGGR